MAEGDAEGDGEVLLFLVVSFLVVSVVSFLVVSAGFLVVSVEDFFVVDFLVVVSFLAGDFSGAVVVEVSVLLVLQELRSAATAKQVME